MAFRCHFRRSLFIFVGHNPALVHAGVPEVDSVSEAQDFPGLRCEVLFEGTLASVLDLRGLVAALATEVPLHRRLREVGGAHEPVKRSNVSPHLFWQVLDKPVSGVGH